MAVMAKPFTGGAQHEDPRHPGNGLTFLTRPPASAPSPALATAIFSIQSHVVYGHVGNAPPSFRCSGSAPKSCRCTPCSSPATPAIPAGAAARSTPAAIDECVAGLAPIGALARCDGVSVRLSRQAEIGEAMLRAVAAVRAANPAAVYCCDPVIGDVGRGVYVEAGVAEFFRDRALPAATIVDAQRVRTVVSDRPAVDESRRATRVAALRRDAGRASCWPTSLTARRHAGRRARHDRRRRRRSLAAAHAAAADRRQRRRRPDRGAVPAFHWLRARARRGARLPPPASTALSPRPRRRAARELALVAAQDEFVEPSRASRPNDCEASMPRRLLHARRVHRDAARRQPARRRARRRRPRRRADAGDRRRIQPARDRVRRSRRAIRSTPRRCASSPPAANCRSPAIRRSAPRR